MAADAGTVSLVTGAASGIGRAGAVAFARSGAAVAALDVDAQGLAATAELVREVGSVGHAPDGLARVCGFGV